jgi:hypothetical protein
VQKKRFWERVQRLFRQADTVARGCRSIQCNYARAWGVQNKLPTRADDYPPLGYTGAARPEDQAQTALDGDRPVRLITGVCMPVCGKCGPVHAGKNAIVVSKSLKNKRLL